MKKQEKIKVILDKKSFLEWRFNCNDDLIGLAEDVIKDLRIKEISTFTLKEVAETTGYIPLIFVLNKRHLPDNILDEDKREIEVVEECDFIFK